MHHERCLEDFEGLEVFCMNSEVFRRLLESSSTQQLATTSNLSLDNTAISVTREALDYRVTIELVALMSRRGSSRVLCKTKTFTHEAYEDKSSPRL